MEQNEQTQQPIGFAQAMHGAPGFTMVCFAASEVPEGTTLYAGPPSPNAVTQNAREDIDAVLLAEAKWALDARQSIHAELLAEAKWALDVLVDQFNMEDSEGVDALRAAIARAEIE